jgi:hypothetical protein
MIGLWGNEPEDCADFLSTSRERYACVCRRKEATMPKQFYELAIETIRRIKRPCASSPSIVIGLAIILMFGTANRSHADDSPRGNRDKIAEMTALVRHNEHCPEVPPQWSIAYLMLLTMAPPTEEQVVAKEREMLALSGKLGNKKWCQLYSLEMEQAYIIYRLATQR